MKIIKPYGKTLTIKKTRKIKTNDNKKKEPIEIKKFTEQENKLLIAEWVSIINKIIKKSDRTKNIRDLITDEAWVLIKETINARNPNTTNYQELEEVFKWKMNNADNNKGDYDNGKWYKSFVGDKKIDELDKNDAKNIAEEIKKHLLEQQKTIRKSSSKQKGLEEHRANSIEKNVISIEKIKKRIKENTITEEAKQEYKKTGYNLAKAIAEKPDLNNAMKKLHKYWQKIFKNADGSVMNFAEAKKEKEELLKLHLFIKEYYKTNLKRKYFNTEILPKNMDALYKKIEQKLQNKTINDLIRLGKIIHYTKTNKPTKNKTWDYYLYELGTDKNENNENNENNIYYLTSQGQYEIKMNEDFVRIWRTTLSMAARTIKNWADPERKMPKDEQGRYPDIIGIKGNQEKALEQYKGLSKEKRQEKAKLLFGDSKFADVKYLELALDNIQTLRNKSFHFSNGINGLVGGITGLKTEDSDILENLKKFWEKDEERLFTRNKDAMRAANLGYYFSQEQNQQILDSVLNNNNADLSLPRFNKFVKQANNNKMKNNLNLPKEVNQLRFKEYKSEQCKYTAFKLLYETAFKNYLLEQSGKKLKQYANIVVKHTTKQARNLSKNTREFLIASKAENINLNNVENIKDLFSELDSYMATEIRTQKEYSDKSEEIKKGAEYIEKLKLNILILAFDDFIKANGFEYIAKLNNDIDGGENNNCIDLKNNTPNNDNHEDWEYILYFLVYLIPVEDINNFLHRIYKWQNLSKDSELNKKYEEVTGKIIYILKKYMAVTDERLAGGLNDFLQTYGSSLIKDKKFIDEIREIEKKIGSNYLEQPLRSLRSLKKMDRFGYYRNIEAIIQSSPIEESNAISKLKELEGEIAKLQNEKKELHRKWTKNKKLSKKDKKIYENCVEKISKYRELLHHINMQDYDNLGKMLITIIGRFIDYAGIFERDLYFVTLALFATNDKQDEVKEFLKKKSPPQNIGDKEKNIKDLIKYGSTEAIERIIKEDNENLVASALETYMDIKNVANIRHELAHFNILEDVDNINLTNIINDVRAMMAYDRKLRNAVVESIIGILDKEGAMIIWDMKDHNLESARIASKKITHLNDKNIKEKLLTNRYLGMIHRLFGGKGTIDEIDEIEELERIKDKRKNNTNSPKTKNKNYKKHKKY